MSGLSTHSGLALADLAKHRGLESLASIDGMVLASGGTPATVTVSGAGSSSANGVYALAGTIFGRPRYTYDSGGTIHHLRYDGTQWRMGLWDEFGSQITFYYRQPDDDSLPPASGWVVDSDGMPAAPTLSY